MNNFITSSNVQTRLKKLKAICKIIWKVILILIVSSFIVVFFSIGVGLGFFASLVKDEPIPSEEEMKASIYDYDVTSQIYFANNELLGNLQTDLERKEVSLQDVSKYAIDAIIATEDHYFYEHHGIVPKAILRAAYQELTNAPVQTGGSTLTQQLVKNQLLSSEVSFKRKAKEMLLAIRLERFLEKDEILEAYLNIVSFGRNSSGQHVAGIESAAQGIFGVSAKELNLPQAAFIAGLPQNPYKYTPFHQDGTVKESLEPALNRMKTVLKRMLKTGYITQKQYEEALAYDIKSHLAKPKPIPQKEYPYIHFEVERRAKEILAKTMANEDELDGEKLANDYKHYEKIGFEARFFAKSEENVAKAQHVNLDEIKKNYRLFKEYLNRANDSLRKKGYQIYTTLDKSLYDTMEKAKNQVLDNNMYFQPPKTVTETDQNGNRITKRYPMQIGAILIENETGKILSFIGGRDFTESQFNYATQAHRSNGSTIKPLLDYAPAMELGILQPGSILMDAPLTVNDWKPTNYGERFRGPVTVREALKDSLNIPAARAFLLMKPYEATAYLEKMGITSLIHGSDRYNVSMSLGALTRGVTVEENTNAFVTFANGGKFVDAYMIEKITTHDGKVIYEHKPQSVQVFSPQTAYLTIDMMRDVLKTGTASKLSRYLKFSADWAGKTGTSQEWHDSWFIASNPNVTFGIWTGFEKPMSLNSRNYSERTQRLWALLINAAYDKQPEVIAPQKRFLMPSGIVKRKICGITGKLPSIACEQAGFVTTDLFHEKFVPREKDELKLVRYVVINGKSYAALDATPKEFTKQGVYLDANVHLSDWNPPEGIVTEHAKENGKKPKRVETVTVRGRTIAWSPPSDDDIVGFRIYRFDPDTKETNAVGSVASFSNEYTFHVHADGDYFITAVDVSGNESSPSETITIAFNDT